VAPDCQQVDYDPGMAPTRAEQAEKTRRTVLATARRLFRDQGYDATSLQMIADAMNVTKANVYYYFRTKAEILEAITETSLADLSALLDEAEQLDDRQARLGFVIDGFVDLVVLNRSMSPMDQTDPGLRRHGPAKAASDALADRGLRLLFGDSPTPDERAAYYLVNDLGPLIRRFPDLPDDELAALLKRLLRRVAAG
jgi:AcrR family transcriptional regulator